MAECIVGLDPGLHVTGYGVVDVSAARPALIEAGVVRVPANRSLADRLNYLYENVVEILAEHQPTAVAVEELFSHYDRPKTAVLMGHARGVLVLAAGRAGIEVASYLPTRVKKSTTGSGRATKEQMQSAIQYEFGLPAPPSPADVADALAVALCHYHNLRFAD